MKCAIIFSVLLLFSEHALTTMVLVAYSIILFEMVDIDCFNIICMYETYFMTQQPLKSFDHLLEAERRVISPSPHQLSR